MDLEGATEHSGSRVTAQFSVSTRVRVHGSTRLSGSPREINAGGWNGGIAAQRHRLDRVWSVRVLCRGGCATGLAEHAKSSRMLPIAPF